ncbi:WD40 repeat-like protein [Suillus weaverae]|nr:WD40 repeat-like protein [Suillus weaverae]
MLLLAAMKTDTPLSLNLMQKQLQPCYARMTMWPIVQRDQVNLQWGHLCPKDGPHKHKPRQAGHKKLKHFVTSSYDGHLRLFDYSQNLLLDASVHQSPTTSVCVVPSSSSDTESRILASSSHDLTACLTHISLSPESPTSSTVASLHLHTSPLSSISTDPSGPHLLTTSWDGVWDTSRIDDHQVDLERGDHRKKQRKTAPANIKRKAPIAVLKSHTARVSKALSAAGEPTKGKVYSCGFDSTVRTWGVESGVCINTINVPDRPMLDLAETADGNVLIAASTDRTVSIFDLRVSSLSSSTGILMHPATPSSIATSESGKHQVVTGGYGGVARLLKNPIVRSWFESPTRKRPDIRKSVARCEIRQVCTTYYGVVLSSITLCCELHERPRVDLAFNVFECPAETLQSRPHKLQRSLAIPEDV